MNIKITWLLAGHRFGVDSAIYQLMREPVLMATSLKWCFAIEANALSLCVWWGAVIKRVKDEMKKIATAICTAITSFP
jgi:hypothetical protein